MMYALLRRWAPPWAADAAVVVARAVLIVLIVLLSDKQLSDFPYLQL
jgi:hypothetical protein